MFIWSKLIILRIQILIDSRYLHYYNWIFGFSFYYIKMQVIKKPFRVAIEGNVGSGKSTLIKYFEKFKEVETNAVSLVIY